MNPPKEAFMRETNESDDPGHAARLAAARAELAPLRASLGEQGTEAA